ncbi:MAG TPA: hypothetical protein VIV11_09305 [Kofleriaceae bacterium]
MPAERILALALGLLGVMLGGNLLWTGKFTAGSPNRPWLNVLTIFRTKPTTFHPVTVRFCGTVIAGLSAWLVVLAIVE